MVVRGDGETFLPGPGERRVCGTVDCGHGTGGIGVDRQTQVAHT